MAKNVQCRRSYSYHELDFNESKTEMDNHGVVTENEGMTF